MMCLGPIPSLHSCTSCQVIGSDAPRSWLSNTRFPSLQELHSLDGFAVGSIPTPPEQTQTEIEQWVNFPVCLVQLIQSVPHNMPPDTISLQISNLISVPLSVLLRLSLSHLVLSLLSDAQPEHILWVPARASQMLPPCSSSPHEARRSARFP
ncbi:hypothetical protein EDD16DRAFT_1557197 [Pisolithus croceorrhizus]|nr:hypothetical protein EDD16DRAFT_1557197 [Pisolithus croceorrhizus]